MKGQMTPGEAARRMTMQGASNRLHEFWQNDMVKQAVIKVTSKEFHEEQARKILGWDPRDTSRNLSRLIWSGTLGLQGKTSLFNLLEIGTKTAQVIPARLIPPAMSDAMGDMMQYVKYRQAGLSVEDAGAKAFKILEEIGHTVDSRLSGGLVAEAESIFQRGNLFKDAKGALSKVEQFVMTPFRSTEQFTRLVSAHGARRWIGEDPVLKVAPPGEQRRALAWLTSQQSPAGLAGKPRLLAEGLFSDPLLGQFMRYPISVATQTFSTGRHLGGEDRLLGGGLGRALMVSVPLYEIGKHLFDTDLDRVLLVGGLPQLDPNRPFYPFPLAPPIASVAKAGADVLTGQEDGWANLTRASQMFVPGGVAIARMAGAAGGALGPDAGQEISRVAIQNWVDWRNPVNGNYPVFDREQRLIGYYPASAVIWRAMTGDNTSFGRESEAVGYLLKQRDMIRDMRFQYAQAIAVNDYDTARRVEEEYARMFPGQGPLRPDPQMMQGLERAQQQTRLDRTLSTLPADLRDVYRGYLPSSQIPQSPQRTPQGTGGQASPPAPPRARGSTAEDSGEVAAPSEGSWGFRGFRGFGP
jgi:hypothetical protein